MSLQICTSVSSVYDVQERCILANSSSGVFFSIAKQKEFSNNTGRALYLVHFVGGWQHFPFDV